ncbi:MAG: hypothetical protein COA99_17515 [Moraxellaceae bacterium]|nr:MAG: hypothetical protein COA99_17515 [Moraxellaceae bacterium]
MILAKSVYIPTKSFLLSLVIMWANLSYGEPYLAVKMGLQCQQCHVNKTGGGLRNDFAQRWAQQTLPRQTLDSIFTEKKSMFAEYIDVGFDARGQFEALNPDEQAQTSAFVFEETLLYGQVELLPGFLTLYADQRLGPGNSQSRELLALMQLTDTFYLKLGRMFIPYGLRLEDDEALIRSATGVNFFAADDGVEIGWETQQWFAALAVTNGQNGAVESEKGKQASLLVRYVDNLWQLGASLNHNSHKDSDKRMANIMAGLKTGKVYWLLETDWINDETVSADIDRRIHFIEANIELTNSGFLKISAESYDPDLDQKRDSYNRYGLRYSYFPVSSTELVVGVTSIIKESDSTVAEGEKVFLQLHLFY